MASRRMGGRASTARPSASTALDRVGTPADVLGRHGVRVRGRMAFCPFHTNHRTPALSLFTGVDGKPRWRCHGCEAHGDALDLEARLSGREVADVIREYG